jgi:ribonuclease HII
MRRALSALQPRADFVLIDGPLPIDKVLPQRTIVDGDALCTSIAAASIVAKVARDALMCRLDALHPEYGFASHKGYATPEHLSRLAQHGPSVQHRRSWLAVRRFELFAGDDLSALPIPLAESDAEDQACLPAAAAVMLTANATATA